MLFLDRLHSRLPKEVLAAINTRAVVLIIINVTELLELLQARKVDVWTGLAAILNADK